MTDERDDDANPQEEAAQPDDVPSPAPASPRREPLRGLDAFAAIQRQLAAVDFTALTAAQRAIEQATAFRIPEIRAVQDAVAKHFAQSIDFARLATVHTNLVDAGALTSVAAARKQWADSLSKAVNFSALHDAITSSAALNAFAATNQTLTDSLKQQAAIFARIAESANFDLPKIDFTKWIEALDRWIPVNLRGLDLDLVATLALEEGLPLSWIPRAEIVVTIIEADSAEARRSVLSDRRGDILDDCEAALASITHEWAVQCRSAIAALRLGVDGPAQSHAANIVDSIVLALHGKNGRGHAKERAKEDLDDLPLQLAAENLTLRPLFRAFTAWWPDSGVTPPDHFARHATSHAVGHVGVFAPLSALIAVMLATSLTRQYAPDHSAARDTTFDPSS